jgi:hypothetical protein
VSFRSDIGGYENRRRRRLRNWLFKFVVYGSVIGAFSYWSYMLGRERAENVNRTLREQVAAIADENQRFKTEAEAAIAARVQAVERAAAFQRQYEAEVPQGAAKEIMVQVIERLKAGVKPDRIGFVINTVENETECDAEIQSKRFLAKTSLAGGANTSVIFHNTVTVTGQGESARDSAGNIEARFDPEKPVLIEFILVGGRKIAETGVLPLHKSIVINSTEYRFTVSVAPTSGFITVSGQRCAYP